MNDCMTFPDTVEEFMKQYKVVDTDGIYMSKGAELVPIFRMRQWFEHLPSAQSDVPDTNVGDTISRQAAIDAPERFIKDCNPEHFVGHQKFIEFMDGDEIGSFGNWQFANGFNMGLTAAEVAIKKLPSAQPEIIRCGECRHYRECEIFGKKITLCKRREYDALSVEPDDFCSYAERREE